MAHLLRVLLGAALLWLLLVAVLSLLQSRLVFLPEVPGRALRATPEAVGLDYDTVWLQTEDGERLQAWHVPVKGAEHTLLHFHGNAGNIGDRVPLLALFAEAGVHVLMVEYRGYGGSSGRPSEEGLYADARAAWRYLVEERGLAPARIVLHGESLGGGVASYLAATRNPAGLILQSSFTSLPDVAADIYPWAPVRLLARLHFDTFSRLPNIRAPVLIVHGRDDEIVPFTHALRLKDALGEQARLLALPGDHNGAVLARPQQFVEALRDFVDDLPR